MENHSQLSIYATLRWNRNGALCRRVPFFQDTRKSYRHCLRGKLCSTPVGERFRCRAKRISIYIRRIRRKKLVVLVSTVSAEQRESRKQPKLLFEHYEQNGILLSFIFRFTSLTFTARWDNSINIIFV